MAPFGLLRSGIFCQRLTGGTESRFKFRFFQIKTELGWYGSGDQLPGYHQLEGDDKSAVLRAIR